MFTTRDLIGQGPAAWTAPTGMRIKCRTLRLGWRWEAKRHTALDEPVATGGVPDLTVPEESKAVSALRSATAVHGP